MKKVVLLLLVLIGVLLLSVGMLLGQRQRSKFDKYLSPTAATSMEIALLRVNLGVVKSYLPSKIPIVYYDATCPCFKANSLIDSNLMKKPLEDVRREMMVTALVAEMELRIEFPEFPKETAPNRDFKMEFFEAGEFRAVAEYADRKIVFK